MPKSSSKYFHTKQIQANNNLPNRDRVSALIFLVICFSYGYQTTQIPLFPSDEYEPFTARTLPILLTFIGIGLSILLLVTAKPDANNENIKILNYKLLIKFLVLMALYGLGLTYIGFALATGTFLLIGFYLLGERRKTVLFGASFPFAIAFYLLLTLGLGIYLEPGIVFSNWL
ncbi:tripartite tricarboxylate transporter TctB family protein [Vibrio aquimaris]|uniref:Tripartite tricarboxylate transporter TctB family protein n=1 Tax=Vibrio aquimaris TaxID=2587862 RepID=A0A5P9CIU7_9VIBR|nr:tripartite tricarboxylate transporter TctB family protein [Vibrio aquimaris]QFT26136.1 Tripartite tricarboxylate transporter TctB family protein [Vibrio aquimaris]